MHEGHRQRMLQRLNSGEETLQDHELLEILLFNAIPRRNTNDIAHNLLSAFGSLNGVMRASVEQLKTVEGVGAETAAYLRCIALLFGRVRNREEPAMSNFTVEEYTRFIAKRLGGLQVEVIEIYCFDAQKRMQCNKRFTSSRTDSVSIKTEELSRFIVSQHPHGIILAHNHPYAPCDPSEEDERFTAQVMMLCSINNVQFYDHIIVGKDGTYSYFRLGRMEAIRKEYNIFNLRGGRRIT